MKTQQTTLNISFPNNEVDLYNETLRISQLTYTPSAMLVRGWIRDGINNLPKEAKLMCGNT
mgnify:CR=1 FL=1